MKPTVISTFAGCGGSSLGYHLAGFRELLANDFDDNAAEVFKLNFPDVPHINRDIHDLSVDEVLEVTGLKPGELDVFDGSPPCQGFSMSGSRKVNDDRNNLFKEYVRMVEGLKPKVFIMENVTGMIRGKMKGRFYEIMDLLETLGYNLEVKQMNAKYYNVPQSRPRLFFMGVRKDIGKPSWPTPNEKITTFGEACEGLTHTLFIELERDWYTRLLWEKMPPGCTGEAYHPKGKGSAFNFCKVSSNNPCPTIPKTLSVGSTRFGAHVHHSEPRTLSIEEAKRVSSFPDDFILTGTFQQQWARIGNSVMPNMMKAIAEHIKDKILTHENNQRTQKKRSN